MTVPKQRSRTEAIRKCEKAYRVLAGRLAEIGFIWPGSVQSKRLPCGKSYCACHKDPEARHGPYWYWTSKKGGKTVSRMLTQEEAAVIVPWIKNRQEVDGTLWRMRQVSAEMLALLLPAEVERAWPELPGRKGPGEVK